MCRGWEYAEQFELPRHKQAQFASCYEREVARTTEDVRLLPGARELVGVMNGMRVPVIIVTSLPHGVATSLLGLLSTLLTATTAGSTGDAKQRTNKQKHGGWKQTMRWG